MSKKRRNNFDSLLIELAEFLQSEFYPDQRENQALLDAVDATKLQKHPKVGILRGNWPFVVAEHETDPDRFVRIAQSYWCNRQKSHQGES